MKKVYGYLLCLIIFTALILATSPSSGLAQSNIRLIVKTNEASFASAKTQLKKLGNVEELQYVPNTVAIELPRRAAGKIGQIKGVVAVEKDVLLSISHHRPGHNRGGDDGGSTQPAQETPWGVSKIKSPDVWAKGSTGDNAKVCVADTGGDKTHADLSTNIKAGRNFTGGGRMGNNVNPDAWQDGNGHGTHVSGTIAAINNTIGVVGVAPSSDLYIAKVLDDNGSGWTSWIANGLGWCGTQGVHTVNMSFGGGGSSTLQQAIKDLYDRGIVLVAASGNSGLSSPSFPAAYAEVIAVGATNLNDVIASFSNRGEALNAPGVDVKSTLPGGSYGEYSGTSMAAPHVTGIVALIVSAGETNRDQIKGWIINGADTISGGKRANSLTSYNLATQ